MEDIKDAIFTEMNGTATLGAMAKNLDMPINDLYKKLIELRNNGYVFYKRIYDNGNIKFFPGFRQQYASSNSQTIKLMNKNRFSAMVISDLHVGNELQNLTYLDKIYEYCTQHTIHLIINCGDIIDGTFSKGNQVYENTKEQLEFLIKNHPSDENILNLMCLGNHDYTSFKSNLDASFLLENARYDFIPLGYGIGIINIENDQIIVRHNISDFEMPTIGKKLILEGHHHKASFDNEEGFIVNIPTLSDLILGNHQLPGAMHMVLTLNEDGYIEKGIFDQFVITNDKLILVNESNFDFDLEKEKIYEKYSRPKLKELEDTHIPTQTEKFNNKWRRN